MKKKVRKIVVDKTEYFWSVGSRNCDGDGGMQFKFWKNKKLLGEALIHRDSFTPKDARFLIEAFSDGGLVKIRKYSNNFENYIKL